MSTDRQQRIGRTVAESDEYWPPREPQAPKDAPNVLLILLDDVGFANYGCFGSSIETPAIDKIAAEGLRYTNFHTTAVCSPTRASLLTGRNNHSVGFGHVTERLAGYPGYSMRLPSSAVTIAEVLKRNGYSTRAVGKWHLAPSYETGPQGPYDRWPLGKGFDRFYGFLGGSTDQFAPELYRDNTSVPPPSDASDGYHLSADLADEAIAQLRDLNAMAPDRPFFMYLAPGACHVPHQAPREWIEHYRGAFDHGWDAERERILRRQIEMGVMPEGTRLGVSNPGIQAWETLPEDERRVYARMMEVYAAFLSYTDEQLGRVFDYLDTMAVADNTIVMLCSDNGASGEGGPEGSVDEGLHVNNRLQYVSDALRHIDDIGGPALYNHYPWGWAQAGNTPFRWYKQFTHAGGITNGLFVRWPAGGVPAGEFRRQYHHVIDIVPTLLDAAGIDAPEQVNGVTQQPMHGESMRYSFGDAGAKSRRHTQYYETWGNRGLWQDGWMAICRLHPDAAAAHNPAPMTPFDELSWELYDHENDPTECEDLAEKHPAKLRELSEQWWAAAGRYEVLPIDTRPRGQRWAANPPLPAGARDGHAVFRDRGGPYTRGAAPKVAGRSFRLTADVTITGNTAEGVLYTVGGVHGGYCWYLHDGEVRLEVARSSVETETAAAALDLRPGRHRLDVDVDARDDLSATVRFTANGTDLGQQEVTGLLRRVPLGCGNTYVGYAIAATVSRAFSAPFEFNGELHQLMVNAKGISAMPAERGLAADMREQ